MSSNKSTSDLFGTLISDTEQHFRLHRNSVSSIRKKHNHSLHQNQSPAVHTSSSIHHQQQNRQSSTTTSDENFSDTNFTQKINNSSSDTLLQEATSKICKNNSKIVQTRQLMQNSKVQDHCCPGFAIPKGNTKNKYSNNGCSIV